MSKISYEDASKELNEIIKKIESGDATIEKTVELIERGKILLKSCYEELDKAAGKLSEVREIMGKIEEI